MESKRYISHKSQRFDVKRISIESGSYNSIEKNDPCVAHI